MPPSIPTKPLKQALNDRDAELVEILATAIQRPISLWQTAERTSDTDPVSSGWNRLDCPNVTVQAVQSVPDSLLEQAAQSDRAVAHERIDDTSLVACRLGSRSKTIAVVHANRSESDLVVRLVESIVTGHQSSVESSALQAENDTFAMQLASDLEELTFLRSMVEQLSSSRVDDDLVGMAESTLPVLNATVRACCLAFLSVPNVSDPYQAEVAAVEGEQPVPHAILLELVNRFGTKATRQPLVLNWQADEQPAHGPLTNDEEPPAGVRSLVLAPLRSGEKHYGWLVAINRAASSEFGLESSWQLASDEFGSGEGSLMATSASILATHAANRDLLREKELLMVSMVRALVSAIEAKDHYTHGHSERVALYTRRIAEQMGYDQLEAEDLYLTALLHDVGKIGVSDAVLKKAGKLTDEEFAEIARHPDEGWAILSELNQLSYVLPGVLHHHERWDGAGYPDGLVGESIPLEGRVMAVADAYDAMTSDRPYRQGMESAKAESIIRDGAGTQWDPLCVEAFFACLPDIYHIKATYQQRDRPVRTPTANREETLSATPEPARMQR